MIDSLLVIGFSSLLTGLALGTLIGAEVYKRALTKHLLERTLESER